MNASPSRLTLGRAFSLFVAWTTVPLYIAGVVIWIGLEQRLGLTEEAPLEEVFLLAGFGAFAVVGAMLVARRPGNPVSWIMTAIGLIIGISQAAEAYAAYVMTTRGQPDAVTVLGVWVNAWIWYVLLMLALVFLPLLFPDGHLPSPRWRPLAMLAGLSTVAIVVVGALGETLYGQNVDYQIGNPIGITGLPPVEESAMFPVFAALYLICLGGATAAVIVRFRRSCGVERQQLKWFLFATALLPIVAVADGLPAFEAFLLPLIIVALPSAVAIAVLRYRLYDIDLIIRRTLVYGVLTVTLALIYFGSVALLQSIFTAITGRQSAVITVASTLAIAVLFNPLRRRVQDFIDHRFYRRKYDAAQTLSEFAATARAETDLERLSKRLVATARDTVQPAHVGLWLMPDGGRPAVDRRL